jgi:hypothetical protein
MSNKQFNKEDLFYCYSIALFHFLKANGFFYLAKGLNENTNKNYWVFVRTPDFLEALTTWGQVRSTFK